MSKFLSYLNPKTLLASLIDAWNYSRIIFINAVTAGFAILWLALPELLNLASMQDWSVLFPPRAAMIVAMAVNGATIFYRLNTFSPPGATVADKIAIKEAIEDAPSDTTTVKKDLDVGSGKAVV
jgi:hypothetical protein